jgi:hypothetical protein
VWVKQNEQWKAVTYHGTWIGQERTKTARPLLPEPTGVSFGYTPKSGTEQAIWTQHEAIEQASATADQATYRKLTTPDFVRVTGDGSLFTRDGWIGGLTDRGPRAQQTNVRLRVYSDMAVLSYLNVIRGPDRPNAITPVNWMTRLFAK